MDDTTDQGRAARADLCAGGAFVALGGAFAIGALGYDVGSALEMGPGYVPLVLGGVLAAFGVVVIAQGVVLARTARTARADPADRDRDDAVPHDAATGDESGPVPWRRGGLLVAAVIVFGLTVDGLGLGGSLFLTSFLAALAGHRNTPVKALLVAAGLTVFCLVVFVAVLQLRLPLLGEWLGG